MKNKILKCFSIIYLSFSILAAYSQDINSIQERKPISIIIDSVYKYYKCKNIIELELQIKKLDSIGSIFCDFNYPLFSGITDNIDYYIKNKSCGILFIIEDENGNFLFQDMYNFSSDVLHWQFFNKKKKKLINRKVTIQEYDSLVSNRINNRELFLNNSERFEVYIGLNGRLSKGIYSIVIYYGHCSSIKFKENYWFVISNRVQITID